MYFNQLFRKKISIRQGKRLLQTHCKLNGFDDNPELWKATTHRTHLFAYHRRSNNMVANNWVSYHPIRENLKYTVWIDLVSKEITEILR